MYKISGYQHRKIFKNYRKSENILSDFCKFFTEFKKNYNKK